MNREDVFTQVRTIFREIFDDAHLEVNDTTTAHDIYDWDSLTHINLISAIQRTFNIKFALGELQALRDVGAMIDLTLQKATGRL